MMIVIGVIMYLLTTMYADLTPFECPVCFEQYDDGAHTPTTLPCGHSCCLQHINALETCFSCRRRTPMQHECSPNFALRDGSLLYFRLLSDIQRLHLAYNPNPAQPPQRPANRSNATVPSNPRVASIPSSSHGPTPENPSGIQSVGRLLSGRYFESDEGLAQRMQEQEYSNANIREEIITPPVVAAAVRRPVATNTPIYQEYNIPTAQLPSRQLLGLKACGHVCTPSSLHSCCACTDRRPVQEDNTYPVYVDGRGWRETGSRSQGYCPLCK